MTQRLGQELLKQPPTGARKKGASNHEKKFDVSEGAIVPDKGWTASRETWKATMKPSARAKQGGIWCLDSIASYKSEWIPTETFLSCNFDAPGLLSPQEI